MTVSDLLIATDEAGYGPRLGPLVVASTVWRLPANEGAPELSFLQRSERLMPCFAPLTQPFQLDPDGPAIQVGDSKQVFRPRQPQGLVGLEGIVAAALRWARILPGTTLAELLTAICPTDCQALGGQPWFSDRLLSCPFPGTDPVRRILSDRWDALQDHWQQSGIALVDVLVRVIDASTFNRLCQEGGNKADLLSEATTGLVVDSLGRHVARHVHVYCDRHGGRRYYGDVLQQARPDAQLFIEHESAQISCYRQPHPEGTVAWQFSVKGDAFPPVSLSSIIAKYVRERMMECFNAFWQKQYSPRPNSPRPKNGAPCLKPTAGYPQDADRFLAEIEATRQRLHIDPQSLRRQR